MNIRLTVALRRSAFWLLAFCILILPLPLLYAQGSAFTYQGRLNDGLDPANGNYDLTFALFSVPAGGSPLAGPLTNSPIALSNGLFTATLDFGAGAFAGPDRWLEIAVRANGSTGAFQTLSPRQKLTAAPYAISASNLTGTLPAAQLSGALPSANLSGTYAGAVNLNNAGNSFTGNGSGLTSVNAATLGGLSSANFWRTTGNAGTTPANFLGTTDNQALDLRVNGVRALRLQPSNNAAPSMIAGSSSNVITAGTAGATIAGGDRNFIESFPFAESHFAFIGGGSSNKIGYFSFNAAIGGGFQNTLEPNDYYSTIAGGLQNRMGFHAFNSVVSGGRSNVIENSVDTATIGGGAENGIGYLAHYTLIGAGRDNVIRSNAEYSVISGGRENTIEVDVAYSHIGGGERNLVGSGWHGTIAGGGANFVGADSGTIGGGTGNRIGTNSYESVISGGSGNIIYTNAERSTIAGGVFHEIKPAAAYAFVGGGTRNFAETNAYHATITGGSNNKIDHDTSYCSIGGGKLHTISPQAAHATIAGGDGNIAGGEAPAIGGGTLNTIEPGTTYGVIDGGGGNRIVANSFSSTIAGGYLNQVNGNFSFAAGQRAQANHPGTFAWAGGNTMVYASTFPFSVNLYSSNGVSMDYGPQSAAQPRGSRYVYIGPINAGNTITTWNGARLTDGGIWSNASDRSRKTDFQDINARTVLEKLLALPVRQWRYTNETVSVKHLGPVAQDFQSAFGLGDDDKSIGTVDADGVALAAIQGLNQKLEDRTEQVEERSRKLEAENAQLRHDLAELKALVQSIANRQSRGAQ